MPMISMRKSKEEMREDSQPHESKEEYPWGLRITLEEDSLDRLGMDTMPEVSKTMTLIATVEVVNVSENANKDEETIRRSLGLQITDMNLSPEKKAIDLKKIYDNSEG